MRVLILGASGMLGNAVLRVMSEREDCEVFGTLRAPQPALQTTIPHARLLAGIQTDKPDGLAAAFAASRPDAVINCIGLVKQLGSADDPLEAIPINSLLPHRVARLCELAGARLVHVSTDCVFNGARGGYRESDVPDAQDLYGRSKLLGEVDYPHAVTLRTSIIGHELRSAHGLVDWFLSQQDRCLGYERAVFSGLPTVVLARVIRDVVLPRPELRGLYHVAAEPISKHDLLEHIARVYGKTIEIVRDSKVVIDRSLDGTRFREATGFVAPAWPELIAAMHSFQ